MMMRTLCLFNARQFKKSHIFGPLLRLCSVASNTSLAKGNDPDELYRLLDIELRGNEPAVLKSYSWFATTAARELGIRVGKCWSPRKATHERLTLLKSVHVHKKHRVQYEVRTYFHYMEFLQLTGSTTLTFLEYIQRNLPEGVAMIVTKHKLEALPESMKVNMEKSEGDSKTE